MANCDHLQHHQHRTYQHVRTYPFVEGIERQVHRTVSIRTRPTNGNLAKCSPQRYSPLFQLPAELRSTIFEFVCRPYEDSECRYDEGSGNAQFYRPEHEARHITCTSLLSTCRLVWLEANHLPLQLADHSFFFRDSMRPRYLNGINWSEDKRLESTLYHEFKHDSSKSRANAVILDFLTGLTVNNRENLKHIHLYAGKCWLSDFSGYQRSGSKYVQMLSIAGVCPEILTITVRSSDWLGWDGRPAPVQFDVNDWWVDNILKWPALPRLREIRLELEVDERKGESRVPQLEATVRDLRGKFALVRRVDHFGTPVSVRLELAEVASPARVWSGWALSPLSRDGMQRNCTHAVYFVKTLVWKIKSEDDVTNDPANACNTSQQAYYPGPRLPKLSVDGSYHMGNGLWVYPADPSVFIRLEKEWQERGSLLQFVR